MMKKYRKSDKEKSIRDRKSQTLFLAVIILSTLLISAKAHASIILGSTNVSAASTINKGLIGYWTFNNQDVNWATGKAYDRSGNGNDGQLTNMSTSSSPAAGKMGQGLRFRSSSADYINIPSLTSFSYPYSISFWFKVPALGKNGAFLSLGSGNDFYYDGGSNRIIYLSSGTKYLYSSKVFTGNDLNKWQHAVITLPSNDVSTWTIYVNNAASNGANSNTGSDTAVGTSARLGMFGDGSYPLDGSLDDVRVYNRALSTAEIRQLYQNGQVSLGNTNAGTASNSNKGATSLNTGLVGYWSFNNQDMNWATGKAYDRSGNGNDGQLNSLSTSTSPVSGKIGQALLFNGISSSVDVPHSFYSTTTPYSYAFWVKGPNCSTSPTDRVLYSEYNTANLSGFSLYCKHSVGSKLTLDINVDIGSSISVTFSSTVFDNKWHHIVLTENVGNGKLYVDGAQDATTFTHTPGTVFYNTASFGKIMFATFPLYYFNGAIDDFRTYNRVLSPAEARQLYQTSQVSLGNTNAGIAPNSNKGASSLNTGLVGYWSFNNQDMNWATGKAYDRSGNGNDGQLTNMSTSSSPVAGKLGQGLGFNGTNSYIDYGSSSATAYNFGVNSFSVSTWVNPSSLTSDSAIVAKIAPNLSSGWYIRFASGNAQIYFRWDATHYDSTTGFSVPINKWTHITTVVDRTNNKVYIYANGSRVGAGVDITGWGSFDQAGDLFVGDIRSASLYPFSGIIDDVRIYNRALSASEVNRIYNTGR